MSDGDCLELSDLKQNVVDLAVAQAVTQEGINNLKENLARVCNKIDKIDSKIDTKLAALPCQQHAIEIEKTKKDVKHQATVSGGIVAFIISAIWQFVEYMTSK